MVGHTEITPGSSPVRILGVTTKDNEHSKNSLIKTGKDFKVFGHKRSPSYDVRKLFSNLRPEKI